MSTDFEEFHRADGPETKEEEFRQPTSESNLQSNVSAADKLLHTLEIAKAQYFAARGLPPKERLNSAVFLRDTCENAMTCLKGTDVGPGVLRDIEIACSMASTDAVILNEGKKRKFDLTLEDRQNGAPPDTLGKGKGYGRIRPTGRETALHRNTRGGYRNAALRPVSRDRKDGRESYSRGPSRNYHGRNLNEPTENDKQVRAAIKRERRELRNENPYERRPLVYTRTVDSYKPGN